MKYLFIDTETTGLAGDRSLPANKVDNWPRLVQVACLLYDESGELLNEESITVRPEGFIIPNRVVSIHGISTMAALLRGTEIDAVLDRLQGMLNAADCVVGHNIEFDSKVVDAEFVRAGRAEAVLPKSQLCTKKGSTDYCKLPGKKDGEFKWPSLDQLHLLLFGHPFDRPVHDALVDARATAKCFWELKKLKVFA